MTWSPAHNAVERQDLTRLRGLLDAGHDAEDDNGDGWPLLRHAIDIEYDGHVQSGEPLHTDVTASLLARGANPLRQHNGVPVALEAEVRGHWLATEIMKAWIQQTRLTAPSEDEMRCAVPRHGRRINRGSMIPPLLPAGLAFHYAADWMYARPSRVYAAPDVG
jgi:GNAT superfamily N-acetyltransferase